MISNKRSHKIYNTKHVKPSEYEDKMVQPWMALVLK